MEATQDETYNGWSNYPTWAVNLWLNNEEGLYRSACEITRAELDGDTDDHVYRVGTADALKFWVTEMAPDLGASFSADLLGWALDSVDWFEIADAFIESVQSYDD